MIFHNKLRILVKKSCEGEYDFFQKIEMFGKNIIGGGIRFPPKKINIFGEKLLKKCTIFSKKWLLVKSQRGVIRFFPKNCHFWWKITYEHIRFLPQKIEIFGENIIGGIYDFSENYIFDEKIIEVAIRFFQKKIDIFCEKS